MASRISVLPTIKQYVGRFTRTVTCLFMAVPTGVFGQDFMQTITGSPSCGACRIEQHLLATLEDTTYGPGAFVRGASVHVNRDSTFLMIAGSGLPPSELFVVTRVGSITRRIGRGGEGPGEYRLPMYIAESADSYMIFDVQLGRITHLDRGTLRVQRTVPVPGSIAGTQPAVFPDGAYVFFGDVATRESVGQSLHFVGPDGRLLRSFGPPPRDGRPTLTTSGDSAVWVGYDDYRIELWHREGRLVKTVRREADWVQPDATRTPGRRFTGLSQVREDDQGRIWTHTVVRVWDAQAMRGDPQGSESIIEVLDLASLSVLATLRIRKRVFPTEGEGVVFSANRESASGAALIDVWAARFVYQ